MQLAFWEALSMTIQASDRPIISGKVRLLTNQLLMLPLYVVLMIGSVFAFAIITGGDMARTFGLAEFFILLASLAWSVAVTNELDGRTRFIRNIIWAGVVVSMLVAMFLDFGELSPSSHRDVPATTQLLFLSVYVANICVCWQIADRIAKGLPNKLFHTFLVLTWPLTLSFFKGRLETEMLKCSMLRRADVTS